MNVDELFCKWAEQRFGLENVTKVVFEDDYDQGYSTLTPGIGDYTAIYIYSGRDIIYSYSETETIDLIREIAQFSLTGEV